MEAEEQIMILMDGLDECEEDADLLEQLGAEPLPLKRPSMIYDYRPALLSEPIEPEPSLKVSNQSMSTNADTEVAVHRCTCVKTRCMKNYCECFKMGLVCTNDCGCVACGNRERLFLTSSNREITKCKCQKSHCLKKYCECHSSGKRCSPECKCF